MVIEKIDFLNTKEAIEKQIKATEITLMLMQEDLKFIKLKIKECEKCKPNKSPSCVS